MITKMVHMKKRIFLSGMMLSVFTMATASESNVVTNQPKLGEATDNNAPELVLHEELSRLEVEEEIDLGFDPYLYLPEDFNPYEGMVLPVKDIVVYDVEEDVELDFDTTVYLPAHFNPYKGM